MATKQFTYGGFTFEPRGTFQDHGIKKGKREFVQISRALHYANYGNVADGDHPFNYDDFYKAAGEKEDDVFYCQETGELYVPCAAVLPIFDRESTSDEVMRRYNRRCEIREEHERFVKQEALKGAMLFTEEQHHAFNALSKAIAECRKQGLDFAVDGTDVYAFRTDLLQDLTEDMVPMEGQGRIEHGLCPIIETAWDACEGLYANAKP